MTSAELYRECVAGSSKAWEEAYNIVRQTTRSVQSTALTESDREDAAQEALTYFIAGGLDKIRHPQAYKSLLRKKTKGKLIEYIRRKVRHTTLSVNPTDEGDDGEAPCFVLPAPGPDACEVVATRQIVQRCRQLVDQHRDPRCRELLSLYFHYKALGERLGKIAEQLGIPAGTAANRIHTCIRTLQRSSEFKKIRDLWKTR